ncbi:MAG: hypothetical protein WD673_15110 [Alphaproteobacteria bacterium]
MDWRVVGFAVVLATVLLAPPAALAQETIAGFGAAIDGDSLIVEDREVRLFGIDAAEADQECQEWQGSRQVSYPCGAMATALLESLVSDRQVHCVARGPAEAEIVIAICFAAGIDLADSMAWSGWVVADRTVTPRYVAASETARQAQRGLWGGMFDEPSAWRARTGEPD